MSSPVNLFNSGHHRRMSMSTIKELSVLSGAWRRDRWAICNLVPILGLSNRELGSKTDQNSMGTAFMLLTGGIGNGGAS
jgi:hypothetical protein